MMRNGRPYTNENGWEDNGLITEHPEDEQKIVMDWIRDNIRPRKSKNERHSSYGIKHILQDDTDIYLTNNEFKDAMLQAGYEPADPGALNWNYCISERSPAFDRKARRVRV